MINFKLQLSADRLATEKVGHPEPLFRTNISGAITGDSIMKHLTIAQKGIIRIKNLKGGMLDKHHSEETKRKIRESMKGHRNALGHKHTQESRRKMSVIAKKQKRRPPYEMVTAESHKKQGLAVCGANNPSWKGGVTPLRTKILGSPEYKSWRKQVFERDSYTCQECGQRGMVLQAHHIKRFAEYPELRFDTNNGQTLCIDCHRATDTYGGKKLCV